MAISESVGPSADRRAIPAWAMSGAVHLVGFILLALLVQLRPAPPPGDADRPAGIVLVQSSNESAAEYFTDADSTAEAESESASGEPSEASESTESSSESPLPPSDAAEALMSAELDLPALKDPLIGAGELVVTPSLNSGRRPSFNTPSDDEAALIAAEQASRRAKAPSGPAAGVSLFGGPKADGHSFVFVIDRSRSMGEEGLGAISASQKELETQLLLLESNHTFEIIAYHHLPYYLGDRRLLAASAENLAKVKPFFAGLAAFGGTDHEMAILAALRLEPDVIFFLADGGDPFLNEAQLARIHQRARGKTTISCVQFGFSETPDGDSFMKTLAAQNGGGYAYVCMRK